MKNRPRPVMASSCNKIALALVLCFATAASAAETPREVVDRTANEVLTILRNKELPSPQKRDQIEAIVYEQVDFDTLSRLVLARNWSRLTPEQQEAFRVEFKRHLSVTYGNNIDSYKNERLEITGERKETRGDWIVHSKVVRGGPDDIKVDYRLRQRDGVWRIIDVVVEGVSLVSNFRSQFQQIIANGGIEKLLQLLREKNAKGEPLEKS